ncbi:MAG: YbaN family protein [Candidatus Nanopelagicales bacterium]
MRLTRALYLAVGTLSAGIGIAAVVVPGLPTTVFLIVALWCFARSSPRMEAWLRGHRLVGAYLREWEDGRRIPRHVKWIAGISMALAVVLAWRFAPVHDLVVVALAVLLAGVLAWIVRRPEPQRVAADRRTA